MNRSVVDFFLSNPPALHSWDGGKTWSLGGFGRRELEFLIQITARKMDFSPKIIETGAGNSTIAFLIAGAQSLTSIAPDADLFNRIRHYCDIHGIGMDCLDQRVAFSEDALPAVVNDLEARGGRIDVALMDGGHGWPTVFVDFCYLFRALRKGGFLIVDDIQIYSVKELVRFLMEDPNFCLVERMPKTLVFEKLSDRRYLPDFGGQPYICRKTDADRDAGIAFDV